MTAEQAAAAPSIDAELRDLTHRLHEDGVIGLAGAFSRDWVNQLGEDIDTAFAEACERPGGAVERGPHRYYVEIHPEQLRGFVDLVSHPWITAVDTETDMGPFEVAPGTHWDDGADFGHGMFPAKAEYPRFEALARRKYPRMGDISIRSALTVHRGTTNQSAKSRPVLVLGVDAPGAGNDARHDTAVTGDFWRSLPDSVRAHLHCPIVGKLEPITQKHTIEGLVMGEG